MFDFIDPKTFYTLIHLLGVALGAGGALLSDIMFLVSTKDKIVQAGELRMLRVGSKATWFGLALLYISGYLLFSTNPEGYMASSKFISKMIIVGVLTVNGVFFHFIHLPHLKTLVNKNLARSRYFKRHSFGMYIGGVISVVSWILALLLGGLRSIPISVSQMLVIYLILIILGIFVAEFKRRHILKY